MRARRPGRGGDRSPPRNRDYRSEHFPSSYSDTRFRSNSPLGRGRSSRIMDGDRRFHDDRRSSYRGSKRSSLIDKRDPLGHGWPSREIGRNNANPSIGRKTYIDEECRPSQKRSFFTEKSKADSRSPLELPERNVLGNKEYHTNRKSPFDIYGRDPRFTNPEDRPFQPLSSLPVASEYASSRNNLSKISDDFTLSSLSRRPHESDGYIGYLEHGFPMPKPSYEEDRVEHRGKDAVYTGINLADSRYNDSSASVVPKGKFDYHRAIESCADDVSFKGYDDRDHNRVFDHGTDFCLSSLKHAKKDPLSPINERGEYMYSDFGSRGRNDLRSVSDELYMGAKPIEQEKYTHNEHKGYLADSYASRQDIDCSAVPKEMFNRCHDADTSISRGKRYGFLVEPSDKLYDYDTTVPQDHHMGGIRSQYGFGSDAHLVPGFEYRLRSPLIERAETKTHKSGFPSPGRKFRDEVGMYVLPERVIDDGYAMHEAYIDDPNFFAVHSHSVFGRIQRMNDWDEELFNEDSDEWPSSSRSVFGRMQHQQSKYFGLSSRVSDGFSQHTKGTYQDFRVGQLKRKFKTNHSGAQGLYSKGKRDDDYRSFKFQKGYYEDRHVDDDVDAEESFKHVVHSSKPDLPEGSEEFKQLVHKTFLRYSKLLNENLSLQKKYLELGRMGSLMCIACGSLSKEFGDAHSLVSHAFNTLKASRAEHLGLHKALCTMLGWHSDIAPDNNKRYQSLSVHDASARKQDLILWPPIVFVHNVPSTKDNLDVSASLTCEKLEQIIRDIGFVGGRAKICQASTASGLFLVKFMPTFSGLQDAEKLHMHYSEQGHGKKEMQLAVSGDVDNNEDESTEAECVLYGYLGTAENVCMLDQESKKRCVVKSRKDIEAIADVTLNSD